MKKALRWLVGAILIAVSAHLATVWAAPYAIMWQAGNGMRNAGIGDNRILHAPPVTAASRSVVRPSPDLAYSICRYNLANGPVRLKAPKPDVYFSMSAYANNTDNFFVLNDRDMGTNGADVVLATVSQADRFPGSVVAPSATGVVLFRRVVPDGPAWSVIRGERAGMACDPITE
ncbi:MAG: DUF1254 domain-containing protein [Minwuiales bacterium]|nr:DUF1254 domain-containing protein [Minwuiales bacterium]